MQTEEIVIQPAVAASDQGLSRRNWHWWLVPRPFDLVSSLLYLGVLAPFLYSFFTRSGYTPLSAGWQAVIMVAAVAILLGIDRLEYRLYGEATPGRAAAPLFIARVVLIEIACWLDQFRYSPFLYLILLFLACLYFGDLVGYGMGVLALVVYIIKHFLYGANWLSDGTELHYLMLFILGCIFSITIARVVARERASRARAEALLAELERSHQQLKDYAAQIAELATTRERNRLAREIHDSLGHYLTVINVQLEKAQVFREKRPREAEQAVSDAKRLASEALQDVRRSVSALRTTHELPAFISSIHELVEHVQDEHRPIMLHIEGNEAPYSRQSLLALYRAMQESLTNVHKHAGNCQVEIDLCFGEQEATLVLRDNGRGFDPAKIQRAENEAGYGLLGVQERLELVGGTLAIESAPGQGTTLLVHVPSNGYLQREDER